jgi:hypothetical protein
MSHITAPFFVNGVYYASMLQDGLLICAPLTLLRSTSCSATPVRQPFYFVTSVGSRRNRAIH